jgi:hypothetical protein
VPAWLRVVLAAAALAVVGGVVAMSRLGAERGWAARVFAAGAIALVVGLAIIVQGLRADLAQRRWQHTSGRIVSASRVRLTEDGRRMWDVQVSWRDSAGQEHVQSFRLVSRHDAPVFVVVP